MNDISQFLSTQNDDQAVSMVKSRTDRYLAATEKLYSDIEAWLRDSIDRGFATGFTRRPIPLMEQISGTYNAPELMFNVGTTSIRFVPKGANIMGADGRVDAQSSKGRHALIVLTGGAWHLVDTATKRKQAELSEKEFLQLLKHLIGS